MKGGFMLAGAVAGLGSGIASIAGKYIDAEMAQEKAEALAALQVRTAQTIREQDDAFKNDPTRVARDREKKRQDVLAAGAAARESELAGLNDANLQGARRSQKDSDAADETRREAERTQALTPYQVAQERARAEAREGVQTQAMKDRLPLEVQRAAAVAEAQARASAKYRERPPGAAEKLADIEAVLGRKLAEPEKLALLGLGKDKSGATEETTFEPDEKGNLVPTKRVVKGPAGSNATAAPQDQMAEARRVALEGFAQGKGADVVARMEKQGLRPVDIVALIGEDNYAKAKGTKTDRTAATAPAAPREVTPPDSPSGRFQARQQSLREEQQAGIMQRQQQAAAAFAEMGNDPAKAEALQNSPLFNALTREQKAQVQRLVMGR